MNVTASPVPATPEPWGTSGVPLVVIEPGGWQALISVAALFVSVVALWYSLSQRARVEAIATRAFLGWEDGTTTVDGDAVDVFNTGRASVIITDVRALASGGRVLKSPIMTRGHDHEEVLFPSLPMTLAPQGVLNVWFSSNLTRDDTAGLEYGYEISYLRPRPFRTAIGVGLVVKARNDPPTRGHPDL